MGVLFGSDFLLHHIKSITWIAQLWSIIEFDFQGIDESKSRGTRAMNMTLGHLELFGQNGGNAIQKKVSNEPFLRAPIGSIGINDAVSSIQQHALGRQVHCFELSQTDAVAFERLKVIFNICGLKFYHVATRQII